MIYNTISLALIFASLLIAIIFFYVREAKALENLEEARQSFRYECYAYREESDALWQQFLRDVADKVHMNTDKRMDRIYAEFDQLFKEGDWEGVNTKLEEWDVSAEPFQMTACVLMATSRTSDKIPARSAIVEEIDETMEFIR